MLVSAPPTRMLVFHGLYTKPSVWLSTIGSLGCDFEGDDRALARHP
jgi:hypothetical protein